MRGQSYAPAAALIGVVCFVVLLMVHLITSMQVPDSVPDCAGGTLLGALSQECEHVAD